MHVWPVAAKIPATTPLAAASRSASAKIMCGDLPPSSRLTRARCSAAPFITSLPVDVAPVNATLSTPGCATSGAPAPSPKPVTTLNTPGGKPASSTSAANSSVDAGACSAGLTTNVHPAASAGASFQLISSTGEFHGRDRRDDADRLLQRVDEEVRAVGGDRLAVDLVGRAREPVVVVGEPAQLALHLADELAVVGRLDDRDPLGVLGDEVREAAHEPRALGAGHRRPRSVVERRARGAHRRVDVLGPRARDVRPRPAGERVDALERLARARVDPFAADEHAVAASLGGRPRARRGLRHSAGSHGASVAERRPHVNTSQHAANRQCLLRTVRPGSLGRGSGLRRASERRRLPGTGGRWAPTRGWRSTSGRRRCCEPGSSASHGSASSPRSGTPATRTATPTTSASRSSTRGGGRPRPASTRPATSSRRCSPTRTRRRCSGRSTRSRAMAPLIHECLGAIADEADHLIVDHRRERDAPERRGQRAPAHARGRDHELHRGHPVERARRRHERDRHRDRRRPRRAGLRARALQRGRAALDLLGGADPRTGHGPRDRRDRPHRRLLLRSPAQPLGRDRDRARRRGVAAARDAGARPAPARPLRRPRRLGARVARARDRDRPAAHEGPARAGAPRGASRSRPAAAA